MAYVEKTIFRLKYKSFHDTFLLCLHKTWENLALDRYHCGEVNNAVPHAALQNDQCMFEGKGALFSRSITFSLINELSGVRTVGA